MIATEWCVHYMMEFDSELKRIAKIVDDFLSSTSPDEIHFGHVGDIQRIVSQLRDVG
jgi:hypothetical protein